jgi:hypothetical protein
LRTFPLRGTKLLYSSNIEGPERFLSECLCAIWL